MAPSLALPAAMAAIPAHPARPFLRPVCIPMAVVSALVATFATLLPRPVEAQASVGARSCFQAGPLPGCRSWWVTESSVGMRFRERTMGTHHSLAYSATVGWMRNTSPRSAVGGVIQASDAGVRIGPRLRRWLHSSYAVDVELGPRWEPGRIEVVEFEASISGWDLVGFTVAAAHDFGGGGQDYRLGIRAGRWAGLTTYGIALVGFGLFLATVPGS